MEAGAPVLVLESMKMETVITPRSRPGCASCWSATGGQVETGMPMVRLEPLAEEEAVRRRTVAAPRRLRAGPARVDPRRPRPARAARCLDDLRGMLLGFDVAPPTEPETLAEYQSARAELAGDPTLLRTELDVVTVFADLAELTRNRPAGEETSDVRVHSPREYFHSYLHSLDVDREHLPDAFRTRLARVLAHYGVTDLDRSPALEEAVFRIFLAQQRRPRTSRSSPPCSSTGWLTSRRSRTWASGPRRARPVGGGDPAALPHRGRAGAQRAVPLVRPAGHRGGAGRGAGRRARRARLPAHRPDAPDYAERLEAVAAIPEQVVRFLAERLEQGIPEREPMLEVLARRHYREHELHDLRSLPRLAGRSSPATTPSTTGRPGW